MTPADAKRVIESFYTAFNRGDRDVYCALLHPDFQAEIVEYFDTVLSKAAFEEAAGR